MLTLIVFQNNNCCILIALLKNIDANCILYWRYFLWLPENSKRKKTLRREKKKCTYGFFFLSLQKSLNRLSQQSCLHPFTLFPYPDIIYWPHRKCKFLWHLWTTFLLEHWRPVISWIQHHVINLQSNITAWHNKGQDPSCSAPGMILYPCMEAFPLYRYTFSFERYTGAHFILFFQLTVCHNWKLFCLANFAHFHSLKNHSDFKFSTLSTCLKRENSQYSFSKSQDSKHGDHQNFLDPETSWWKPTFKHLEFSLCGRI